MKIEQLLAMRDTSGLTRKAVQSARDTMLSELAKWDTNDAKKTYSPQHISDQKAALRAKARTAVQTEIAKLENLNYRRLLAHAAKAWSIDTALTSARLVPAGTIDGDLQAEILDELRRARITAEVARLPEAALAVRVREVVEDAGGAQWSSNQLAQFHILRTEIRARKFADNNAYVSAKVAADKAYDAVVIPGRHQALELLDEVAHNLDYVAGVAEEVTTGKKPPNVAVAENMARLAVANG